MATAVAPLPQITSERIEPEARGWTSWITTTDHKRIGILYMVTTFVFFCLGGVEALMMRLQLGAPDNTLVTPQAYNQLFTLHGTTMVFLFVVPMMAGLANYFVPLMIGARDVAFPRLNALSYWLLLTGGIVFYASLFFNPPEAGWTSVVPLASSTYSPDGGIDAWIYLIHLTGLSSILGAINLYVTILNMRAPGMGWARLPLFCWTILTFAILLILALPSVAAGVTLLLTDRHFGTHFYDPTQGGSALLWQHLFWFFGHPEVYIMILPGFGIISEVLPVFARKPIFGYRAIAAATIGIAFLSLLVWVHHMFVAGIDPTLQIFFMASTMLIAVPTGVKIFSWLGTLWGGALRFRTAMLFAMAFIVVFTIGGISGVFLGSVPVDVQLSDTYFVVAHIHYVLVQGALFCAFAAFYYWMPKMSGRLLSEQLGRIHFFLFFIGVNMAFFPMHQLGLDGMPRRTFHYPQSPEWASLNLVSTIGAYIIGISILVFLFNFVHSIVLKNGRPAGDDPWEADTLEWATTSPPQPYNFARIPVVHSARPLKEDVAH